MATIAENSKIKFRYGTQNKLDSIIATGGESGTFYLTEDTHRLYVGLDDKSIVPVNEGIVTYTTLPEASVKFHVTASVFHISDFPSHSVFHNSLPHKSYTTIVTCIIIFGLSCLR